MKVTVLQTFGDKDNFTKKYSKGAIVEFPDARATILAKKGLVSKEVKEASDDKTILLFDHSLSRDKVIEALNTIGLSTPKNIGEAKLTEKLAALTEDESNKLKAILVTE